ncbi:hypothetical protein VTK73DRAFT_8735 [Phialemonium thermophilum]|uniref:peptidylprolyl isomerase n=1 Tax=Phialemonium thermophilum TaxID=223376 RepID=A0ABR3W6P2_9PEZI
MPRLLHNSRRDRERPSSRPVVTTASNGDAPLDLPPYEPPRFPMNDAGKRTLQNLWDGREIRKYERHLGKSIVLLRSSVGAANDRLYLRKSHLAQMVAKRQERGDDEKKDLELAMEESTKKLAQEVAAITEQSEEALRQIIDYRIELDDERSVMSQMLQQIQAQEPRQPRSQRSVRQAVNETHSDTEDGSGAGQDRADGDDTEMADAEENATPYEGASQILDSVRRAKAEEYNKLSMYERYALNNDYIAFKRTLHDAQYQDEVPLPDATTWFTPDGRPTGNIPGQDDQGADAGKGKEEDDLVIEREVLSLKCPLTLRTMSEPYTSRACKHTFEKDAILQFIRQNGGTSKCPVCPAAIHIKDLYLDEVMQRKIQRLQTAASQNIEASSDVDADDADDASMVINRSRRVKKEKSRRTQIETVDDDES